MSESSSQIIMNVTVILVERARHRLRQQKCKGERVMARPDNTTKIEQDKLRRIVRIFV
jgi:hypothetical protein